MWCIVCFCDCTMPHLFPIITPTSNLWAESLRMCNVYTLIRHTTYKIYSVCVCRHVFNSSASYCVSCYMMDIFMCMDIWTFSRIDSSPSRVLRYVCVLWIFSYTFSSFSSSVFPHDNIIYRGEPFFFSYTLCWDIYTEHRASSQWIVYISGFVRYITHYFLLLLIRVRSSQYVNGFIHCGAKTPLTTHKFYMRLLHSIKWYTCKSLIRHKLFIYMWKYILEYINMLYMHGNGIHITVLFYTL